MCVQAPQDSLWDFLKTSINGTSGRSPCGNISRRIEDSLGVTVEDYVGWLHSRSQNVYRVKDMDIVKVQDLGGGKPMGSLRYSIAGPGGVLSQSPRITRSPGVNRIEVYSLEPGKCYQVRFPLGAAGYRSH